MDEDKPKKKRKKASAADDGAGEHKRPWQENLATMAEIKAFVSDRYYLRYNVVRRGVECRRPSSYDHDGTDWQLISDRIVNSLRVELSTTKSVRKQDIWDLIESDFTPEFHPFLYYLDHLPPWDGQDYIMELSVSVSVAGGVDKQLLFAECLKKWLVGMVAGWVDPMEVNHLMLVLVGRQGTYKTTWFNYILPPPLRSYFMTKTNAARMTKDDRLALLQFGHLAYGLGEAKVGRAFTNLGFKPRRTATGRGYYVVQRTTDEIESRKRLLAIGDDSDG